MKGRDGNQNGNHIFIYLDQSLPTIFHSMFPPVEIVYPFHSHLFKNILLHLPLMKHGGKYLSSSLQSSNETKYGLNFVNPS